MTDIVWPPRQQRHKVDLEAAIVETDGSTRPITVSDLSLEGCKVTAWLRIGDEVTLRLPRVGLVRGQVRWALSGRAGIRFFQNVES